MNTTPETASPIQSDNPEDRSRPTEAADAAQADDALNSEPGFDPFLNLSELQAELADANDRVLRAHAELENFRKRSNRQLEEERKYASMSLVRDLLSVMDNLERAIQTADKNGNAVGLLEGVKMVAGQFSAALEQHHCRRISARGEAFDPNLHQAIAQTPSEEFPAGVVVEVAQAGYRLHDRVLRPAAVLVSSGRAVSPPASAS